MWDKSFDAFKARFCNEEACAAYLYKLKWPAGFRCTCCGNMKAYMILTRRLPLYECSRCKHQHSLTTGTVMERSRTSLQQWFAAIYLFTQGKNVINAFRLSQLIKVTYKTAWLMLHKLRDAIDHDNNRSLLSGIVRIQGGAYGNPFNPYTERDPQRQPLLAACSVHESGALTDLQLVIMEPHQIQPNGHIMQSAVQQFIEHNVSPDAVEIQAVRFRLHMYRYRPLVHFITEFNLWASEAFHGLSRKYLQAYANEFTFRYNMQHKPQLYLTHFFHLCTHILNPPTRLSLRAKYETLKAS
ncbi:transposase [Paenibacillus xylaniclasticus]|uniref:transposase n=1 Tax=Paenibacillus xylaniclasticus TaxID=588083 RepID=UPI000FD8E306|nr:MULTISPECIES: transposase [Paenibacillus]GFN32046.1 hypothetical protein PCURB6_23060 [Paenibacillus curdlanolyticus]